MFSAAYIAYLFVYLFIYVLPFYFYLCFSLNTLHYPTPFPVQYPYKLYIMFFPHVFHYQLQFPTSASCSIVQTAAKITRQINITPWDIQSWNCTYVLLNTLVPPPTKRSIMSHLQIRGAQISHRSGSDHQIQDARMVTRDVKRYHAAFIRLGDLSPGICSPQSKTSCWPATVTVLWLTQPAHIIDMNHKCMLLAKWTAFHSKWLTFVHLYRASLLWCFSAYSCRDQGHYGRDALF